MSTNISQSLLPEFDVEIANTRKTLERVPEGNPDFRPHPKSMTLARLAGHVDPASLQAVAGAPRPRHRFDGQRRALVHAAVAAARTLSLRAARDPRRDAPAVLQPAQPAAHHRPG